ncbi:MAG: response regulator [Thermoanaerobaculia bacterium]
MDRDSSEERVLLVEDDTSLSDLLELELRRAGLAVTSTDSSVDAILKLQREKFSVLLLDIMLSGSSGLYVVDALRDLPTLQRPRVVIMTGARGNILTTIDRAVVKAVFFKPLDVGSFAAYVKSLSGSSSTVA